MDPGFVPGLIGAGIAKLLDLVIEEAKKTILCKEYCKKLTELLDTCVRPVVIGLEQNTPQEAQNVIQPWLVKIETCLKEAMEAVNECNLHAVRFNVIVRHRIANKILKVTEKLKDLADQASPLNLAFSAKLFQELIVMYNQDSVAAITQGCTQSEIFSKQRAIFQISQQVTSSNSASDVLLRNSSAEVELELQPVPETVFGVEDTVSMLENVIRDETAPKWVGLWGKGGSGKTLLAQCVNNSPAVHAQFGDHVYWITIARRPDIVSKQQKLCKLLGIGEFGFQDKEGGKQKIFNRLYRQPGKVLLILDDVWIDDVIKLGVLEWFDVVHVPGSKILVTSRDRQVFDRVDSMVVETSLLSEDHSWSLLCTHAFPGKNTEELKRNLLEPILVETIKSVVAECKGLPLALKVTGGSMAGRQMEVGQWKSTLKKLRDAQVLDAESEKQLQLRLKISYDELSPRDIARGKPDDTLQQCFLYFAAFPEDTEVETEKLIEFWIGDGLVSYKTDEDPRVEGYYIIGQLIGRSLVDIERSWSDTQNAIFFNCKVHDVLRDLALYILEHNQSISQRQCLFLAGKDLDQLPMEDWVDQRPLKAKKVSLMGNQIQEIPGLRLPAPELAVLILGSNNGLKQVHPGFFKHLSNLRVLDLSRTSIQTLPNDIGRLKQLVVLNLSYSSITHVPDSLGKLTRLEHLNMQHCRFIKTFPVNRILNLVNLRYLNVRGCGDISQPQGDKSCCSTCIPQARSSAGDLESSLLHKLGSLKRLTRLWIGSGTHQELPSSMSALNMLTHLSLYMSKLGAFSDALQSLAALEMLDLNGCVSLAGLPQWLPSSFTGLLTLDLRSCTSLSELPPGLEQLRWLTKLDLAGCVRLTSLPDSFGLHGAFPSLQDLWLLGCSNLEKFPELEPGAFPRLSLLNLVGCSRIKSLPVIPGLVRLNMNDCVGLEQLPDDEEFKSFSRLEELFLCRTRLSRLPSSLGLLPRLKTLKLTGCMRLESLPWDPSYDGSLYKSLEEIFLDKTSLTSVPLALAASPQLKKMVLTDCNPAIFTQEMIETLQSRTVPMQVVGLTS